MSLILPQRGKLVANRRLEVWPSNQLDYTTATNDSSYITGLAGPDYDWLPSSPPPGWIPSYTSGTNNRRWFAVAAAIARNATGAIGISSITLDGQAADYTVLAAGTRAVAAVSLFYMPTPDPAEMPIVVNVATNAATGCAITAFQFLSSQSDPRYATGTTSDTGVAAISSNVNIYEGGAVIAAYAGLNAGTTDTAWTNIDRINAIDGDTGEMLSTATSTGLSAETPRTITATGSNSSPAGNALAVVSLY